MIVKSIEGIKTAGILSSPMKNLVVMLPTLDEEFGLREVLPAIPIDELTNLGWQPKFGLSMEVVRILQSK